MEICGEDGGETGTDKQAQPSRLSTSGHRRKADLTLNLDNLRLLPQTRRSPQCTGVGLLVDGTQTGGGHFGVDLRGAD